MNNFNVGERLISKLDDFNDSSRTSKQLSYSGLSLLTGFVTEIAPDSSGVPGFCLAAAIGYALAAGYVYIEDNPISPED